MGKQHEVMPDEDAKGFIAEYRCNRCYGMLVAHPAPGRNYWITCPNEECDGEGFVTVSHIDRVKSNDASNYFEAQHNLKSVLGIENKRTLEELNKSIGLGG